MTELIETEYETMTLQEFYDNTSDLTKVQAILDLPLAHRSMPQDIEWVLIYSIILVLTKNQVSG